MSINASIGVDIGGTNTAIGVVNEQGKVIAKSGIKTPKHGDAQKYVIELASAIRLLIETEAKDMNILGIGIGAPNSNYHRGTIEYPANLSFKGVTPLVEMLKEQFQELEFIALTNDANAATLGEMIYGGAKGMNDFIMYTLGTGVGCGIVVNGDLVYGNDGFAGECGHNNIIPNGRLCGCGRRGHLEAYCSAPGMVRTALEVLAENNATGSPLASIPFNKLESKDIHEAAQQGDPTALEVFKRTGTWLGIGLADAIHTTSPEAIFLFGGPTAAGDYIFKPTKEAMEENLLTAFRDKVEILPSKLDQGNAAIIGASALVLQEIHKTQA